jgi:hypothetical protein
LQYTNIKKLKANEKRKIKTKVTPRKLGKFLFMVMAEYQHTDKTFWMPSIKTELEVDLSEEIYRHSYYPITTYHDEFEIYTIFKFVRSYM